MGFDDDAVHKAVKYVVTGNGKGLDRETSVRVGGKVVEGVRKLKPVDAKIGSGGVLVTTYRPDGPLPKTSGRKESAVKKRG